MMLKKLLAPVFVCLCYAAGAQPVRMIGPEKPLDSLNDEFRDVASLSSWKQWHTTEGQPDKWKTIAIRNDVLQLQPHASGWYGDYQAPFMYKTVEGNFDVRTRIKVSGTKEALPQSEWSLAGIMVRQPRRPGTLWEPRQENWLFLTTGVAEPKDSPVFEVKTTSNSSSSLKLRPAKEGWVELRLVRVQASFILLYRYEGEVWTVLERFYRPLFPPVLQVGINAYSGWNAIPTDIKADPVVHNKTVLEDVPANLMVQVDYVHFARPKLNREKLNALLKPGFAAPYYTPGNLLTDFSVSNKELLAIIGEE